MFSGKCLLNNTWDCPFAVRRAQDLHGLMPDPESPSCCCPDCEYRRARLYSMCSPVRFVLKREIVTDGPDTGPVTETVNSQTEVRAIVCPESNRVAM
jgi:hypothetical protein